MTKIKKWLSCFMGHRFCSRCRLCVEFTGAPPVNPSEILIKRVVGKNRIVPVHWLEEHVADALYRHELSRSVGVNDIGIWGSSVFSKESARVVAEMRPEFGFIRENDNCS